MLQEDITRMETTSKESSVEIPIPPEIMDLVHPDRQATTTPNHEDGTRTT